MALDVVAVDFNPIMWVVWCSICDAPLNEPTSDSDLIDALEMDAEKNHIHP